MKEDIYYNLTESERKEFDRQESLKILKQEEECQGRTFEEAKLQGEFD